MRPYVWSETAPNEGTLQVFPDVLLSNAYVLLRPFFRNINPDAADPLDPANWVLDLGTTEFPGINPREKWYEGQRLSGASHPHMRVDEAMVSVPKVLPGDMVFWHCGAHLRLIAAARNGTDALLVRCF